VSNDNSGWQGQRPGGDSGSQSRYYDRYQQASGEPITAPGKQTPPGGSGDGRTGLLLALIAVVVALAVVATVVIMKVARGGDEPTNAIPTQQPGASAESPSTTPELSWTNPAASAAPTAARPLKPGWNAVLADPKLASAAYDVPKAHWNTYRNKGADSGWTNNEGRPIVFLGNASSYRQGFCKTAKGADLAVVGFYGIHQLDPASETPEVVRKIAKAIALKKDDTSHARMGTIATKQTSVQGLPAVESSVVTTNGNLNHERCDTKKYEVRAIGVTMGSESTLLAIVRAVDVPDALSKAQAEKILHTLRPAAN